MVIQPLNLCACFCVVSCVRLILDLNPEDLFRSPRELEGHKETSKKSPRPVPGHAWLKQFFLWDADKTWRSEDKARTLNVMRGSVNYSPKSCPRRL